MKNRSPDGVLSIVSADADSDIVDAIACPHCGAVRDVGLWDLGTNIECAACNEPFGVPKTPGGAALRGPWPVVTYSSAVRAAADSRPARRSLKDCLGYLEFDLFLRVVRWIGCLAIGVSGLIVLGCVAMATLALAAWHGPLPFLICLCIGCAVVPVAWCYAWYQLLALFLYLVEGWAEHGIRRAGQD